jgi:hypothetical protein
MSTEDPMSTEDTWRTARRLTALALGGVLVILLLVGLLTYRRTTATPRAEAKADQLIAALAAAGAPTPSKTQIVRLLGEDGGAVCADPNSALARAAQYGGLSNGAGGPGIRPTIASSRAVRGELLVLSVYCPEQLAGFTTFVDGLTYADVAGAG